MNIAVVTKSRKGGLFLSPSNFGQKIEFIARQCGEFKEGEVVVALSCIHDTKPETSHLGARFIRVRRLVNADNDELAKAGQTNTRKVAAGAENGTLLLHDVTYLSIRYDEWHERDGPELFRAQRRVNRDGLTLRADCWIDEKNNSSIRLWEGAELGSESRIEVPHELARKILERTFGYDVVAEGEKRRRECEAEEARRAAEKAEAAAKWEVERQRRIVLFFSAHPEAKKWFVSPPIWEDITREAIRHKLARFLRSEKTLHYASASKEFDCYDHIWALQIGDEQFEFVGGSTQEFEYGDD